LSKGDLESQLEPLPISDLAKDKLRQAVRGLHTKRFPTVSQVEFNLIVNEVMVIVYNGSRYLLNYKSGFLTLARDG
ncbi:MAG: hypothetical protein KGI45_04020, partial [Patescibacteria group bacterium]|nr:hypothetical protein [Patescibacteria group bacterium]